MRHLGLGLRILLGAFFIVSAVAKIVAIDDFELYVFSYGFLSLNITYLAVRLCIGVELALGVMIALGWWPRTVRTLALAMLVFFSLFLAYAWAAGRNESCMCMGRLADMPPWLSLLKNVVLIALCLFGYSNAAGYSKPSRAKGIIAALVVAGGLVAPFVVSVPDNWLFGPGETSYDAALLHEVVEQRGLDDGPYLLSMVTPGCPYCKMTRSKIGSIVSRNGLDTSRVVYLEPDDIGAELFLRITYGQRPLVLLLDNGQVAATFHYRNIDEHQIATHLSHLSPF